MRDWILFLIRVNPMLDKLCVTLDKRIERRSLNLTMSALRLYDELFALNGLKVRLVNLRVLYNTVKAALSAEEFIMLEVAAGVRDTQDTGCHRSTAYRRRLKVIGKCVAILAENGYDEKRLGEEFPGMSLRVV